MRLSLATTAVGRVFRRRPSDLLPLYVLGAAAPAITRVGLFLGLAVIYLYLEMSGRLDAVHSELAAIDSSPPDFESEPEAFSEWMGEVAAAFDPIMTPAVAAILALTLVLTLIVGAVVYAIVAAAQIAACDARLRDERGLVAGIAGVRRYWLSFLGLSILETLLWFTAVALIVLVVGVAGFGLALVMGTGLIAIALVLVGLLLLLAVGLVIRAVFAFAPVAIVVDDVGVFGSLSHSVGFIRRQPIGAIFYYVVSAGTLIGYTILISMLAFLGGGTFLPLPLLLVVLPALDLLKTALYGIDRGTVSPPAPVERSLRAQLSSGTRRGWRELLSFVRDTPGLHAVAIATGLVGFWMGWVAADPFVGVFETSISSRLEGHIPPRAALEFFGNNWLVALMTAYSGVALVIPALVSIWFNGLFIGATARLEVELLELVAFVIPHGLLEIPAIFVAGAVGIFLGVAWWQTVRGSIARSEFAAALERAFWVLIGVGIVLAIAAFIEGFVSPYYFRLFL